MVSVKWLGLACVLAAGCGDPQYDSQFRGDSIWSLPGATSVIGTQPTGPLVLSLFWSPQGINVMDPEQWLEQVGTAIPVQVPSPFLFNVYEPPGPQHMLRLPDGSDAGYAVGRLMVYQDLDGNLSRSPGENFVGINDHAGLYYVRNPLPAGHTPAIGPMPAGFYPAFLPQPCGTMPPMPTDPGTCGVPIGASCRSDSECKAGGICILDSNLPWSNGYCTIPDPSPTGCYPAAAVFYSPPQMGMLPSSVMKGFYLKPCKSTADCAGRLDQQTDNYRCDLGLGGCVANDRGGVSLGVMNPNTGMLAVEPFCPGPPPP